MSFKIIELHNNTLKVFECGKVLVYKNRKVNPEYYEKKFYMGNGYKYLQLHHETNIKGYSIHRIVGFAFLNLDLENKKQIIDHKNRDKLDNQVSNLRVVSYQQNNFNTNAKGYYKENNKYRARIVVNGKQITLGYFDTTEEATNAYKQAKLIHHII